MLPSFIIHHPSSVERSGIVKDLITKTGGTVVEACLMTDGKAGCRASHLKVAKIAKELCPTKHYLVFEDDCVLSDDWNYCIEGMEVADVLYLGFNDKCHHTTFGTHALMISPRARDKILSQTEALAGSVIDKGAYDHILSQLCRQEGLLTAMPPVDEKDKWAYQKKGLRSLITGTLR